MSSGVIVIPANHGNKMSTKDIIQDMRNASDEVLMQMAREIVEKQCADSKVLDLAGEARIPKFSSREITLGRVLGRGGFCIVREIEKIKTSPSHGHAKKSKGSFMFRMMKPCLSKTPERKTESKNTEDDCDSVSDIPRAEVAARSKKSRKSRGRYVLKQVAPDLKHSDKITYMKGTVDMAMEAQFLSALDHPNILRLTGVNAQGPYSDGYFLVLEKLNETLSRKIKTWMNMDRQCKGITGVFAGSKRKEEDLYRDRIEASYDIAAGAAYLHEKNVVFRDLVSQYCYQIAGLS
jgi:serine/threonine protein kinase